MTFGSGNATPLPAATPLLPYPVNKNHCPHLDFPQHLLCLPLGNAIGIHRMKRIRIYKGPSPLSIISLFIREGNKKIPTKQK
jgi:hypothetical protein